MSARPGAEHHNAKLNAQDVIKMRRMYAEDGLSMLDLAGRFGITESTAREAIRGITWASVGGVVKSCSTCGGSGRVLTDEA